MHISIQNAYLQKLMETVIRKDPEQTEFHQAVREVLTSLSPVVNVRKELIEEGVMDCLVEPERVIKFRVPWEDDAGNDIAAFLKISEAMLAQGV